MCLTGTGIALAVIIWVVRCRLLIVTVSGESMQPAVASGDRVLVRRARLSDLRPGDVVVVEKRPATGTWATQPGLWPTGSRNWMIKRIAALPGDPCPDPPALATLFPSKLTEYAGRPVPAGKLVILGDNQRGSYDSRVFGYYPADRVLGVVIRPLRMQAAPPLPPHP